jgi:tRNA (guanine-N7-)-methyltransferase
MPGSPDPTRPRFHGRRKGRGLKASQERALNDRLPSLSVDHDAAAADPRTLFNDPVSDVWMEIGFGGGEHLAALAAAHPEIGFIGCEPFVNGVAKLIRAVDDQGLNNVRILADDVRPLLNALPDGSLGRIIVLFPDPWPKKRHWDRRIVGPETLPDMARALRSGGLLRCATDHPGYLDWMLFHVARAEAFDWTAERPDDWRARPADQPPTRYETKALAGRPSYLDFRRR